jgi:Lsr2
MMAQKVTVELTDDLDGSQADWTVRFAVDGTAYEIDLSKRNAAAMRRTFDRYVEHARKASQGARRGRPGRSSRDRGHSAAVREWAKEQGITVSERGRIPASVVADYEAAH